MALPPVVKQSQMLLAIKNLLCLLKLRLAFVVWIWEYAIWDVECSRTPGIHRLKSQTEVFRAGEIRGQIISGPSFSACLRKMTRASTASKTERTTWER